MGPWRDERAPTCCPLLIEADWKAVKAPVATQPLSDRRLQRPLHVLPSAFLKLPPRRRHGGPLRQIGTLLFHQQLGQLPVFSLGARVPPPQRVPLLPVDDAQSGEVWPQHAGHLCGGECQVYREVTELREPSVHLPALVGQVGICAQVVTVVDGHALEKQKDWALKLFRVTTEESFTVHTIFLLFCFGLERIQHRHQPHFQYREQSSSENDSAESIAGDS